MNLMAEAKTKKEESTTMKKMIALGMAAAMMCMSLTACIVSTSSKTETTAAAETTAADTTAEAAKDAESTAEAAGDLVATADYPTKPITMIIPYGAGGTTDHGYQPGRCIRIHRQPVRKRAAVRRLHTSCLCRDNGNLQNHEHL